MALHSEHIAAFTTHHCPRYLRLASSPACAEAILPQGCSLPTPRHQTPPPSLADIPRLQAAFRNAQAMFATLDLLGFVQTSHRRPAYLHPTHITGSYLGSDFDEELWLLRKSHSSEGAQFLLAGLATPDTMHTKRLALGMQAALLANVLHGIAPSLQRPFHIDGFLFDTSDDAQLERQCQDFTQGRRGFDIIPYQASTSQSWQRAVAEEAEEKPVGALAFSWGPWCEDCPWQRHCILDLSIRQDVALVPGLDKAAETYLRKVGINTIQALARRSTADETNERRDSPPHQTTHQARATLHSALSLGGQRAKRLARRYALKHQLKAPIARNTLAETHHSRLPDDTRYHGLRQLFVEVESIPDGGFGYLFAAMGVDAMGSTFAFEMTQTQPTHSSERKALLQWFGQVDEWLLKGGTVPQYIHLYMRDRTQAGAFMTVLTRHKAPLLTAYPALATWLCQPRLLEQDMLSFVCEEAQEQLNIPTPSTALAQLAAHVGYRWPATVTQRFTPDIFDGTPTPDAPGWLFASAPRHRHSLPLHYAQAHWSTPRTDTAKSPKGPTLRDFKGLGRARLEALQAIARYIPRPQAPNATTKEPIAWHTTLDETPEHPEHKHWLAALRLAQGQRLSGYLQEYARPLTQRIEEGTALPLRFDQTLTEGWKGQLLFELMTAGHLSSSWQQCESVARFEVGDVVVLSDASVAQTPWEVRKGWLGRIEEMVPLEDGLRLRIEGVTWLGKGQPNTAYMWRHERMNFAPEKTYLMSPAADSPRRHRLEKVALQLSTHPLLHLVSPTTATKTTESAAPQETQQGLTNSFEKAFSHRRLTPQQRRCVLDHAHTQRLCLHGPPGTGKTETLLCAINARIRLAMAEERPYRVVFCTKQRAALHAALAAFDRIWQETENTAEKRTKSMWTGLVTTSPIRAPLGVQTCHPERVNRKLYAREHLLLVCSPSSAYKLHRKRPDVCFDLFVFDEAQDMTVLEGFTASQGLDKAGQWLSAASPSIRCASPQNPWDIPFAQQQNWPISLHTWLSEQPESHVEQLHQSFTLPPSMVQLFDKHVHWHDFPRPHPTTDGFTPAPPSPSFPRPSLVPAPLENELATAVFSHNSSLMLLVHNETSADQWNPLEASIIDGLLGFLHLEKKTPGVREDLDAEAAAKPPEGADHRDPLRVGVVVGSRRQKQRLRAVYEDEIASGSLRVGIADDFQGQSALDYVIASATCASPAALQRELGLLLHPHRQRLAWSRHRQKLIVLVSQSLFAMPIESSARMAELDLWYAIRAATKSRMGRWFVEGYEVEGWCEGSAS